MITIGIVEDKQQIAEDLSEILQTFDTFTICFIASNGLKLMEALKLQQPQLLIMDIQMPQMDGISAVKLVKEKYPHIKIIMHTVFQNDESIIESILWGANGYLLKNEKPQKIADAIIDVMNGGAPLTPSVAQKLIRYLNFSKSNTHLKTEYHLSEREQEILLAISEGLSYKRIADRFFISTKTVGKHIENIYTKLQVNNKVDAVNIYRRFMGG